MSLLIAYGSIAVGDTGAILKDQEIQDPRYEVSRFVVFGFLSIELGSSKGNYYYYKDVEFAVDVQ